MKKCIILVMLTMGMMNNVMGKEPVARITDGLVVIAPGKTNAVDTAWLNIGENKVVVTPNGNTKVGVGIVRDFLYTAKGGISDASITLSAYDAGVKRTLYSASSITNAGTGSFSMTNTVYSGRIMVEITQQSYTNAPNTWTWAVIAE